MPNGGYFDFVVKGGFYVLDRRLSLSQLNDTSWRLLTLLNSAVAVIYLFSQLTNVVLTLKTIARWNTVFANIAIGIGLLPILISLGAHLFFVTPYGEWGYIKDGFKWKVYEYNEEPAIKTCVWRSEKCDHCYREGERVKWVLVDEFVE